jgi:uncharacterized membrane protein YfcA
VPLGAILLTLLSPTLVKSAIGAVLVLYAMLQFANWPKRAHSASHEGVADRIVGFASGVLGGFAGLSGVLPLIWLQLRGFSPKEQRERYQPFNFLILAFASTGLLVLGKLDKELLILVAVTIPFTLIGAFLGVRTFKDISDEGFRRAVLFFLLISGGIILAQGL